MFHKEKCGGGVCVWVVCCITGSLHHFSDHRLPWCPSLCSADVMSASNGFCCSQSLVNMPIKLCVTALSARPTQSHMFDPFIQLILLVFYPSLSVCLFPGLCPKSTPFYYIGHYIGYSPFCSGGSNLECLNLFTTEYTVHSVTKKLVYLVYTLSAKQSYNVLLPILEIWTLQSCLVISDPKCLKSVLWNKLSVKIHKSTHATE